MYLLSPCSSALSCHTRGVGWARQAIHCPILYIVVGSIWYWSWIAQMFSSSWSMPLFTFLLGMLVISLFWKKEPFLLGSHLSVPNAARLPAPTINVTHSCSASTLFVYNITSSHYSLYFQTEACSSKTEQWQRRDLALQWAIPANNFNLLTQQNEKLHVGLR